MEGIFFARFDDVAGPMVVCEAPEDGKVLGTELFDRVSDYVIAKKNLCGSHLTVWDDISKRKVMSCPLFVENEKLYRRNAFFFAFGFVFGEDISTSPYTAVLDKLSNVMRTLEIEKSFLSNQDADITIKAILDRVWTDLSTWGESIVSIDEANTLALKMTPRLVDPPDVFDFQVPVQVRETDKFLSKEWDLTIQQVVRYIDGERHIKRIAEESGVAIVLVRRSIRQLLYFRCVRLVDIFQYSNSYVCTSRIVELAENEKLYWECSKYIWTGYGERPSLARVFQLYSALQPCLELKTFCLLHDPAAQNIDERRFITFGVLHGIIRRIHKYPVFVPTIDQDGLATDDAYDKYFADIYSKLESQHQETTQGEVEEEEEGEITVTVPVSSSASSSPATCCHTEEPDISALVNGRNCCDAICTELWRSAHELDITLQHRKNIAVVHK